MRVGGHRKSTTGAWEEFELCYKIIQTSAKMRILGLRDSFCNLPPIERDE